MARTVRNPFHRNWLKEQPVRFQRQWLGDRYSSYHTGKYSDSYSKEVKERVLKHRRKLALADIKDAKLDLA